MEDGILRLMNFRFFGIDPDKHIVHESSMPCLLGDKSDWHSVSRICTTKSVFDKNLVCVIQVPSSLLQ